MERPSDVSVAAGFKRPVLEPGHGAASSLECAPRQLAAEAPPGAAFRVVGEAVRRSRWGEALHSTLHREDGRLWFTSKSGGLPVQVDIEIPRTGPQGDAFLGPCATLH